MGVCINHNAGSQWHNHRTHRRTDDRDPLTYYDYLLFLRSPLLSMHAGWLAVAQEAAFETRDRRTTIRAENGLLTHERICKYGICMERYYQSDVVRYLSDLEINTSFSYATKRAVLLTLHIST